MASDMSEHKRALQLEQLRLMVVAKERTIREAAAARIVAGHSDGNALVSILEYAKQIGAEP